MFPSFISRRWRPTFGIAMCAVVAAGVICLALAPASALAAEPKPAPKSKSQSDVPNDPITRKVDDQPYLCSPPEHCAASAVPGQCISLKDGVTCKLVKGKSLFD